MWDMGSQGTAPASGWARAKAGFRAIQLPHFQFKVMLKKRKQQQERLGPGTYNIRDFLQETHPSSLRGICDTREQRFRESQHDCFPGPGTYGPQGNPYALLEERDRRSASTRGLMDSRTEKGVFQTAVARPALCPGIVVLGWLCFSAGGVPATFPVCLQGSGLGPGTYSPWSSTEKQLRQTGGRIPCQVFSRDKLKPAGGRRRNGEGEGTELHAGTAKGFLDELMSKENKKKGCFSTLPRNPGCPSERIFWATLSQCPRDAYVVGPGSYDPKPVERPADFNQPPFWSSAKRFDRKSERLFMGNENPVGVGRYNVTRCEKYPRKIRYQSLYQSDTQRYLSNLKQDAYLLERLKPAAKNKWSHLISAPRCPDTCEESTAVFQM
ncbi:lymphocyte expansion molecule isoform X2 [Phasianus colchicus]|uniref:lymphocyte expansion molecule isoform X2 n=1 Tax=Phasianus colchicus TaxID=9054 RepID=UPI00129ECBF3|nr:lymphocyte expansion molecule isoform X2 [Phasianus colchicus]